MPDISMCSGENCTRKDTCYRYTAYPNVGRQSFFMNPPMDSNGNCEYYIKDSRSYEHKRIEFEYYLTRVLEHNNWHAENNTPNFIPIIPSEFK